MTLKTKRRNENCESFLEINVSFTYKASWLGYQYSQALTDNQRKSEVTQEPPWISIVDPTYNPSDVPWSCWYPSLHMLQVPQWVYDLGSTQDLLGGAFLGAMFILYHGLTTCVPFLSKLVLGRWQEVPAFPKFSTTCRIGLHQMQSLLQGTQGEAPGCTGMGLGTPVVDQAWGTPAFPQRSDPTGCAQGNRAHSRERRHFQSFLLQNSSKITVPAEKPNQAYHFSLNESTLLQLLHLIQELVLFLLQLLLHLHLFCFISYIPQHVFSVSRSSLLSS